MKQQIKHSVFLWLLLSTIGGQMLAQNLQTNINPQLLNVNFYVQAQGNTGNKPEANIQDDFKPVQLATSGTSGQTVNPDQGGWGLNWFGKEDDCNDCDEVNEAIKASKIKTYRAPSAGSSGKAKAKKSGWKKLGYNANCKLKKIFARKYKARTSYAVCFNW